ncbi:hypothetical protein GCM10023114_26230 [Mycolicibacterium sediminis]|uniref:Uncharacterized protein n=2 Tax=Mycolicibacterium sediminis TaxID=1286180 RepID=A0A7I7QII3_9MYCO|nr:hypothetical protein MSEDJ_02290 [Mycolicibacterium sediminis]
MLAVLLIAVGLGDVGRRLLRRRWLPPVVGVVVVVGVAMLAGLWHLGDLPLLAIDSTAAVGWQVSCERAERTGTRQVTPLIVFGAAVAALILLSGWGSDVAGVIGRWPSWVGAEVTPNRMLMAVGVLLVQAATANQLVRLVLGSVGSVKPAGQPQASDQLKGGRLLGPMERLLIVGLGLAGQLTMASAVVAAKSIIRFPEISAKRDREGNTERVGIDDVTEYFLVGSFASWIVAFGGLALVAAAH